MGEEVIRLQKCFESHVGLEYLFSCAVVVDVVEPGDKKDVNRSAGLLIKGLEGL